MTTTTSNSQIRVRVQRKLAEAIDICSLELVPDDGTTLPAFSAGSHVDVHLPGGLIRQYSLCNDPAETHRYLIAVLRDPASRGGSNAIHDVVREGEILTISTPKNHFALAHAAKKSLLLGGGIGVTPILCMAERLAVIGADFHLHYASRSLERAAFVNRIRQASFADKVQFHFDDGDRAQRLDLDALLTGPDADTHVYVCGPKGFMDAVLATARARGWPESQLHWEFFAGADATPRTGDEAFDVQLASSGRVITVASDKTVSQALSEAGVELMIACEQGICGTCVTRVLDGVPDHRDSYLSPSEQASNDRFTPCCSRSKSALLVLDL